MQPTFHAIGQAPPNGDSPASGGPGPSADGLRPSSDGPPPPRAPHPASAGGPGASIKGSAFVTSSVTGPTVLLDHVKNTPRWRGVASASERGVGRHRGP